MPLYLQISGSLDIRTKKASETFLHTPATFLHAGIIPAWDCFMPRKKLIRSNYFPYHVTNRTIDRKFYPLDLDFLWKLYADQLRIATWAMGARVHAFVLMSNHYHLLISTPEKNLDDITRYVQSEISRTVADLTSLKTYSFATRYRWSLIDNVSSYCNVYRYIYQNPLRAGIAKSIADYQHSTIHGILGYSKLDIPVAPHDFISQSTQGTFNEEEHWLNSLVSENDLELIRRGLRRFEFKRPARIQASTVKR